MEHPSAGLDQETAPYPARRQRVYDLLGANGALILSATPEIVIGRDTELRYVIDPELFYLTGYSEPEAVAVFVPGRDKDPFTMFVRPRDTGREQWTGPRGGTEAALERFGAAAAFPIAELSERLPKLVADTDVLYARLDAARPAFDDVLVRALADARRSRPRRGKGPQTLIDPGVLLDELRLIKDEHEIALLRQAARLSIEGFRAAARLVEPGTGEWEVEAAIEAAFRAQGGDGFAFPSIVASGANAVVLHYIANNRVMQAGELVLIDAGARYRGYCGDISRTLPVSGRFSTAQRELYDGVLRAHAAGVAAVQPGVTIDQIHEAALRELLHVLGDLGLLKKNVYDAMADDTTYKKIYPHKTSHWLGLEVHDVGAYAFREGPRPLQPGMVLTIEPGLYIPPDAAEVHADLRGCGIRIEDDVLVTHDGADVLTGALPVRASDIEALWAESRT